MRGLTVTKHSFEPTSAIVSPFVTVAGVNIHEGRRGVMFLARMQIAITSLDEPRALRHRRKKLRSRRIRILVCITSDQMVGTARKQNSAECNADACAAPFA